LFDFLPQVQQPKDYHRGSFWNARPNDLRALVHLTAPKAAAQLGISYQTLRMLADKAGIKFASGPRGQKPKLHDPRADAMAELYRSGKTLDEIGQEFGLTRERIRQLIHKYHGLKGSDGGARVNHERRAVERQKKRHTDCLAKHGCTPEQLRELRRIGREMVAAGAIREHTPIGAYIQHRNNSRPNGTMKCGTELSLWEWWTIWQKRGNGLSGAKAAIGFHASTKPNRIPLKMPL
jgi:hypothetical protein